MILKVCIHIFAAKGKLTKPVAQTTDLLLQKGIMYSLSSIE